MGRFVATPLETSRTRPSSKVVIGVPALGRRRALSIGSVLWIAEGSADGVAGAVDADDMDTGPL